MSKKESFRTVALKTYGRFVPAHVTSPKHRFSQRRSHQRRASIKGIKAASERGLMIRSRRAVSWLLSSVSWVLSSVNWMRSNVSRVAKQYELAAEQCELPGGCAVLFLPIVNIEYQNIGMSGSIPAGL